MANPNACDCECKNACKIDEYLDIRSFSCRQKVN